MVSTGKMVQLRYRIIQYLLLCVLWQLGSIGTWGSEYSSMGVHKAALFSGENTGEIVVLMLSIVMDKIGKKLDKGYRCPVYCAIDHKHIYWEQDETEESNIPTNDGLPRPSEPEDREQSESNIRPIASTN